MSDKIIHSLTLNFEGEEQIFIDAKKHKELVKKLESLDQLDNLTDIKKQLEELSDTLKGTQNAELNKLKDEFEKQKNELKEIQSKFKDNIKELETLENKLDEEKKESAEVRKHFEDFKKTSEQMKENFENQLTQKNQSYEELKAQSGIELYEFYQKLPEEFKTAFSFINGENLLNFTITSGDKESLNNLYNHIKNELKMKREVKNLSIFFDKVFALQSKCHKTLERLSVQSGENFSETTSFKLSGGNQGQITAVLLQGYKSGNKIIQSIVEVESK